MLSYCLWFVCILFNTTCVVALARPLCLNWVQNIAKHLLLYHLVPQKR